MMQQLTRRVLAHKRLVASGWILLTVVGIAAAGPASKALDQRFSVPGREGWETSLAIERLHGNGGTTPPFIPVVTLPQGKTVDSPGVRGELRALDAKLAKAVPGSRIASFGSTGSRAFVSRDGRTTFVAAYPPRSDDAFGGNPDAEKAASRALRGATVAGA